MDGSRTAWGLLVSSTCLPNGPASAKCLASLCCNLHSNREGRGRNGPSQVGPIRRLGPDRVTGRTRVLAARTLGLSSRRSTYRRI
jgi:hypothetical protein